MTLGDILPSLRSSLPPYHWDPELWPLTTSQAHGGLAIGGVDLMRIEERYGTPVYIVDEADVRERCHAYADAFGAANVVYAAKALANRSILRWVESAGLGLAVYSTGQWELARSIGFPVERIVVHNAVDVRGAGRVVIESIADVDRLAGTRHPAYQRVVLRLLPAQLGIKAATGPLRCGDDERFEPAAHTPEFIDLVTRILDQPQLELFGLEVYLGSQLAQFGGYERAIAQLVAIAAELRVRAGADITELNIGGGFAVAYARGEHAVPVEPFAARMHRVLSLASDRAGIARPRLMVTPGRAIVARAGVALYRVTAVRRNGDHQLVAVDGGVSDNPRPALYGARYEAMLVGRRSAATNLVTTVVGRHDEIGDVLVRDQPMPSDLRAGDLLAMPGCGAYQFPLASNYDLVGRPPMVAVRDRQDHLLVRRETLDDMLRRELD